MKLRIIFCGQSLGGTILKLRIIICGHSLAGTIQKLICQLFIVAIAKQVQFWKSWKLLFMDKAKQV